MKLFLKIAVLGIIVLSFSCSTPTGKFPQARIDPEEIVDVKVHRFDKALFELDTADFQKGLKTIQDEFKPLLEADLNDTSNINQLYEYVQDSQILSIYHKTIEVFPNAELLDPPLTEAFTRYHYLFPAYALPAVYTYISDMYFEMPIIIQNSALIVAIDLYLGKSFPLYLKLGLPYYKIKWMEPESLPVDVMKALYFQNLAPAYTPKTLLDRMIDGGKLLAYLDAIFPHLEDEYKISYDSDKLKWANENEKNIWGFLISNKVLYSTDYQTQTKLIQDAPFTTGFSNESPARLGVFIGWKIVTEYMINNPDVSVEEMIRNVDSQKILQDSGYKP